MKSEESLSVKAGTLIVARTIAFIFSFSIPLLLVRIFSKDDFGLYRQLLLVFTTFFYMLQMGMTHSMYYFYPRWSRKKASLVLQTFLFLFLVGTAFLLVLSILRNQIGAYFHNSLVSQYIPLVAIFTLFMLCASMLEVLLIVENKIHSAFFIIILSDFSRTLLLAIAALVTRNVKFLMYALILFSFIRLLILSLHIYRTFGISFKKLKLKLFTSQLKYALPFGLAVVMVTLNTTIDKYFVSFMYPTAVFAVYSIGCFQLPLIQVVFNSVSNILFPKISEYQKKRKTKELLSAWHNSHRKLALVGFPAIVFFSIMSREFIVTLFTDKYEASIPIFIIYLTLIFRHVTMYGVIVKAYGKTRFIFKVSLISFLLLIPLIFLFNTIFGFVGPALAVVSTLYLITILQLLKSKQLLKVKFTKILPWKILFRIFVLALFPGIIIFLLKNLIVTSNLITLIYTFLVYSSIWLIIIFKFNFITREEKKQLITPIRNFFSSNK